MNIQNIFDCLTWGDGWGDGSYWKHKQLKYKISNKNLLLRFVVVAAEAGSGKAFCNICVSSVVTVSYIVVDISENLIL